jgi:hypothetical protein
MDSGRTTLLQRNMRFVLRSFGDRELRTVPPATRPWAKFSASRRAAVIPNRQFERSVLIPDQGMANQLSAPFDFGDSTERNAHRCRQFNHRPMCASPEQEPSMCDLRNR